MWLAGRRDKLKNYSSNKHPNEKLHTKDQTNIFWFFQESTHDSDETDCGEPLIKQIELDEADSLCAESVLPPVQKYEDISNNFTASIPDRPTFFSDIINQLKNIN